jgi:hypothetical protein
MILDSLYILSKQGIAKTRFDVNLCTGDYEVFEMMRNPKGKLFFYYTDVPDNFRANIKRRTDKSITNRSGRNVSSVFVPDLTLPFAYGDVKGTNDAILFLFNDEQAVIELFIAKGKRNNRVGLFQLLMDGQLQNEMEALRKLSKPTT